MKLSVAGPEEIASNHKARAFTGSSLQSLKKHCSLMFQGAQDPRPQTLNDKAWIAAAWKEPPHIVYDIISHSEYQVQKYADQCFSNTCCELELKC